MKTLCFDLWLETRIHSRGFLMNVGKWVYKTWKRRKCLWKVRTSKSLGVTLLFVWAHGFTWALNSSCCWFLVYSFSWAFCLNPNPYEPQNLSALRCSPKLKPYRQITPNHANRRLMKRKTHWLWTIQCRLRLEAWAHKLWTWKLG